MHAQSTTISQDATEDLIAQLPLSGKLRPATQAHAMLSYARVSKSIQTTIEAQHERILAMAKRHGVPVTQYRQDHGKSGWRSDREAYQAVLADLATGQYSHLGLYKADRLARESTELTRTVQACWRLGITVLDTTVGEITPQNLLILAMLAETEIRNLSERTTMGIEAHAATGSKIGRAPLGYTHGPKPGTWIPDPVSGPVMTELFRRAADGISLNALRSYLNAELGLRRDNKQVKSLLRNPYYIGLTVNCKERHSILEGKPYARPREEWKRTHHDYPLTDEATWRAVQARLDIHSHVGQHRERRSPYALQGLMWCAVCRRRMTGHPRTATRSSYRCCVCHRERGLAKVEAAVRSCLEQMPPDSRDAAKVLEEILGRQHEELQQQCAETGQQIKRLSAKRMRIFDYMDDGKIDLGQYQAQIAAVDAERAELQQREAALKAQMAALPQTQALVADIAAQRADWLYGPDKIPAMEIADQQKVYRECCKRIVLDPAGNTLTVEYTDHIALLMRERSHTVQL